MRLNKDSFAVIGVAPAQLRGKEQLLPDNYMQMLRKIEIRTKTEKGLRRNPTREGRRIAKAIWRCAPE